VLQRVWSNVDPDIQQRAHERLANWFDEDEQEDAEHLFDKDE
jgi:hypothetical protein